MLQQKAVTQYKTGEHVIICCSFQAGDTFLCYCCCLINTFQSNHSSPCLNVTPFQFEFFTTKILQHSCLIISSTGMQEGIFLVCKLYKSREDNKLSLYNSCLHLPCHCCIWSFCSVFSCCVSVCWSYIIFRSVSETVYCFFGMYYQKKICL